MDGKEWVGSMTDFLLELRSEEIPARDAHRLEGHLVVHPRQPRTERRGDTTERRARFDDNRRPAWFEIPFNACAAILATAPTSGPCLRISALAPSLTRANTPRALSWVSSLVITLLSLSQ